ncbi:glutamate 5-kinase [bacterium]|nr:glutamate 5-kinase [bacterium]
MTPVLVVKIGTNLLTTDDRRLDLNNLRELVHQLSDELDRGEFQLVVVTSGAITCGAERLGGRPNSIPEKQAAAAVGQILLMQEYARFFDGRGYAVGQLLITKDDLENQIIKQNAQNTLSHLLARGVVPIINENDSVATHEIGPKFGDNDELSSEVARLIGAKRLILLSDIDGVFTSNPKSDPTATRIPRLESINSTVLAVANDVPNGRSRGGMLGKLSAAKDASEAGIEVVIANGRERGIIAAIQSHQAVGTWVNSK